MEYLNGKKWNGNLINKKSKEKFEIKEGKGYIKEYDYDGILEFEGEYLNGEKWNGKGKVTNMNHKDSDYEYVYLNGQKKEYKK